VGWADFSVVGKAWVRTTQVHRSGAASGPSGASRPPPAPRTHHADEHAHRRPTPWLEASEQRRALPQVGVAGVPRVEPAVGGGAHGEARAGSRPGGGCAGVLEACLSRPCRSFFSGCWAEPPPFFQSRGASSRSASAWRLTKRIDRGFGLAGTWYVELKDRAG
jgi:hypothetical protein